MNRLIISLLIIMATGIMTAAGQSKIGAQLHSLLQAASSDSRADNSGTTFTVLVKTSGSRMAPLSKAGIKFRALTRDIAAVEASPEMIRELAADPEVVFISESRQLKPLLDKARAFTKVDEAQAPEAFTTFYDGTGVITALYDIGLDPNHRTFLNDDNTSRISQFWHFASSDGTYQTYTADNIDEFTTDQSAQTHATHVLGIMAGSYDGPGTFYRFKSGSASAGVEIVDDSIPFKGVASGAEIVAACGELYDVNILEGVGNAIEYANRQGRPIVVNLSLGDNFGPHDGSDLLTSALNDMAQDAIVCVAAGNEGNEHITAHFTFTDLQPSATTFLSNNGGFGAIEIWGSDSEEMGMAWVVYDTDADSIVGRLEAPNYTGSVASVDYGSVSGAQPELCEAFGEYFYGSVSICRTINPLNDRVNAYCQLNLVESSSNTGHRYRLGLEVQGTEGQRVDFYTSSDSNIRFTNLRQSKWLNGTTDGTISNLACGPNTIAIGSYTSKTRWANLKGHVWRVTGTTSPGQVSQFSSWANMPDGSSLPHVCAPGEVVTSAASLYYVNQNSIDGTVNAKTDGLRHTTDYYTTLRGTSMATPMAAGTIALWLQADPTLTREGIMDIINHTSTDPQTGLANVNRSKWGAGRINAFEGLKRIVASAALPSPNVSSGGADIKVSRSGSMLEVDMIGADEMTLEIIDITGVRVMTGHGVSGHAAIDVGALAKGIYLLRVDSQRQTAVTKLKI